MRYSNQGFTLLELMFVLGIVTIMAVTEMQGKAAQLEQARARQLGIQIYQYNNAVRGYLAEHPGATGSHAGTSWLKQGSCGGTATKAYLPCSFPDRLSLGGLTLQTTITTSGADTMARTTLPALELAGHARPDLAGLAALTASGGAVNSLLPTMASTDASFSSDPQTAIISFEASTRADGDVWLRTDGGNSMHAKLNFDSPDAARREITGVQRIVSVANSVLTLGDSVINSQVLLNANTEVLGTLTARSNMTVRGSFRAESTADVTGALTARSTVDLHGNVTARSNLSVAGNATVGQGASIGGDLAARNLYTNGNVSANGHIVSAQNVQGTDVYATRNAIARTYYDLDDTNFYMDPAGVSQMNVVDVYYIRDKNDPNYIVDPSHTSRLNYAHMNYARLEASFSEGGACSTKDVGTNASGELMSCVNGQWRKPGAAWEVTTLSASFHHQTTLTCPAGYRRLSCYVQTGDDKNADRYLGTRPVGDNQCVAYNGWGGFVVSYAWMDCVKQ